ncbi:MAG TPA: group III truncated hemoglobin [Hyphomicrobium sp.]|jgi:hemoglobin
MVDAMRYEPHPKAPGLDVGIDEAMIGELVDRFYDAVRRDEILGPVFNARVENWDDHLTKLRAFWSSVVLMTGRYKGRPMPVHAAISEISDAHFERWLSLFAETAKIVCPPAAAALFVDKSLRIGDSLRLGIAASRGIIL